MAQSDEAPQPSFLSGDAAEPVLERDVHPAAPDTAENTTVETAQGAASTPDDEASHRPENSENGGVEANFDETARDAQTDETMGVMVPSDLNPALDNSCPLSSPESKTETIRPEKPALPEPVSRRGRRAQRPEWRQKQLKQNRELKELKRSFEAKIKAGHLLHRDMIFDIVNSAARIKEIKLPPGFPGSS